MRKPHVLVFAILFLIIPDWVLAKKENLEQQLGLIVNTLNSESRQIAEYYIKKRKIPVENVIEVSFPVKGNLLARGEFVKIYEEAVNKTPKHVQFYALAWSRPFRVGCMSVTSAFALGYDNKYCANGCEATRASPYFNASTNRPYDEHGIRPTMMLAGSDIKQIYAMIDRGVQSDFTRPGGTAYLVRTTNKKRNVRSYGYASTIADLGDRLSIQQIRTDALRNKDDVMFYFTGLKTVAGIESNRFLAGAVADHLTSFGGVLFGGEQMSILRWLDAGATASYGTVVEPCAFFQKFPQPGIMIDHYTNGDTVIEAYWKSVAWPGQGVFVGEPLASPFLD